MVQFTRDNQAQKLYYCRSKSKKNGDRKLFIFQRSPPSFQMARVGSHRRWTKSQGPTSGLRQRGLQQITTPGQSDDKTAKKLTFPSTSFIPTSIFRGISVFEDLQPRSFITLQTEDRFQEIKNGFNYSQLKIIRWWWEREREREPKRWCNIFVNLIILSWV